MSIFLTSLVCETNRKKVKTVFVSENVRCRVGEQAEIIVQEIPVGTPAQIRSATLALQMMSSVMS